MFLLENDWKEVLSDEFNKEYYKELMEFVEDEYSKCEVFPPKECVFSALNYTALKEVKCVIFGQDPDHGDGQAHGLAFSVNKDIAIPPSLINIYKELESDVGINIPNHGYLVSLAKQGVLLLNTVLTVRAHEANSHKNKGWEKFSDAIVDILNKQDRPIVYMLWGKPAQSKMKRLNNENHLILTAPHPSPLSSYRGFFGCKHFSKANEFLASNGIDPINWQV